MCHSLLAATAADMRAEFEFRVVCAAGLNLDVLCGRSSAAATRSERSDALGADVAR